jgi:tetraacyldisaccharide 4'-kinase
MLPLGRLRDLPSQLRRANFVVVTKCPPEMTAFDMRLVRKSLGLYPYQSLYFSQMENTLPSPLFPDVAPAGLRSGNPVVAMAGVARPAPLKTFLEQHYRVAGTLFFPDHHPYRMRDLHKMRSMLDNSPEGTAIVTTEKDAVKLTNRRRIPEQIQRRLYATRVHICFIEDSQNDLLKKLYFYVRENQKYGLLHSG